MKRKLALTAAVTTTLVLSFVFPVFALTAVGPGAAPGCELANGDVPSLGCLAVVISNVISILLMFVGAAALIFLLYGSILFITSRGDPKAVEKAKKTMTYAIIGVVAMFAIFIATSVFANALQIPNPLQHFGVYIP